LQPVCLHDKRKIEKLLRNDDVYLHLYEIGDMDDLYWPHTIWFTLPRKGPKPVLLLYTRFSPPVLLMLTRKHLKEARALIRITIPLLPPEVHAHMSPGLIKEFKKDYTARNTGPHGVDYYRMALKKRSKLHFDNTFKVITLGNGQLCELNDLYRHNPSISFDPYMLQSGLFFGARRNGRLVSVGGVHVYSKKYQVAALGSVVTHPDFRGRGLATGICARLCRELQKKVKHIGLNVNKKNKWAIRCYKNLGFETVAEYQEWNLRKK
jgi:ribosomal protein S18 acetylase RimI-like enzyme